jgi:hypothetical protein
VLPCTANTAIAAAAQLGRARKCYAVLLLLLLLQGLPLLLLLLLFI